jgi:ABC-type lipoprotein release transport system permease subunit
VFGTIALFLASVGALTTLTTVTVLLLLVSLVAVCIAAWRAMRISPARALAD